MRPRSKTGMRPLRRRGVAREFVQAVTGMALCVGLTLGTAGGAWSASGGGAPRTVSGPLACYGSMAGRALSRPIVGIAATPSDQGYWLVASDGGIFTFGNAGFFGSTGAIRLNQPIVGMAPTPDGQGYWLVASDGGIFSLGDAIFYGSTGAMRLNKPIVGMAPTPDGKGYWLVASDGGIFTFGDAGFFGSTGAIRLNQPVVGMAATPDGQGYWLAAADAGIFTFGDAPYLGGGPLTQDGNTINDFSAFSASPDGGGYIIADASGSFLLDFGEAPYYGLGYSASAHSPVVGLTAPLVNSGYWETTQDGAVYALTPGAQTAC